VIDAIPAKHRLPELALIDTLGYRAQKKMTDSDIARVVSLALGLKISAKVVNTARAGRETGVEPTQSGLDPEIDGVSEAEGD
jgi:hypothetical protein